MPPPCASMHACTPLSRAEPANTKTWHREDFPLVWPPSHPRPLLARCVACLAKLLQSWQQAGNARKRSGCGWAPLQVVSHRVGPPNGSAAFGGFVGVRGHSPSLLRLPFSPRGSSRCLTHNPRNKKHQQTRRRNTASEASSSVSPSSPPGSRQARALPCQPEGQAGASQEQGLRSLGSGSEACEAAGAGEGGLRISTPGGPWWP